jgi:hypothetical protein
MLFEVAQHVDQSIAHGAWTGERATMPAALEKATTPADQAIDGTRDSNAEPTHTFDERRSVSRLDDQVDMIALDGKLGDSELLRRATRRRGNRGSNAGKYELSAQGAAHGAQCDVNRLFRTVERSSAMGNQASSADSLATGARAATTPAA